MTVRDKADADLNQVIVTGVLRREPTIDFQTALAAGLEYSEYSRNSAKYQCGF